MDAGTEYIFFKGLQLGRFAKCGASHCSAKGAVREVVGLAQSCYFQMLEAFELKDVLLEHPNYSWLSRHAAWVRHRFVPVHKDSDTAFKIRTGRHYYDVELLEFGEVCMARVPLRAHTSRLHGRFVQATDPGKTELTGEFIVSPGTSSRLGRYSDGQLPRCAALLDLRTCKSSFGWLDPRRPTRTAMSSSICGQTRASSSASWAGSTA